MKPPTRRVGRGRGGGLVIAPTHSLGADIPLENLLVLMEELVHQQEAG